MKNRGLLIYFIGIILYLIGWHSQIMIFFLLSAILCGLEVSIEGIQETIENTQSTKKFAPNAHILMLLASIGAILINRSQESALLMIIFGASHYLEEYASNKTTKSLTALLNLRPTFARVVGHSELLKVEDVTIGSLIEVHIGEQIPLDGILVSSQATIDESILTGENIPNQKTKNDQVFGGTINVEEKIVVKVTTSFSDSAVAKIVKLVEHAQKHRSKIQTWIEKLEIKYVCFVLITLPIAYSIFYILNPITAFYQLIIHLIIASPCALAVSVTPAILSSLSALSKKNILCKEGSKLLLFKDIKVIAFDKTGTLTTGALKISHIALEEKYFSIVKSMEKQSNHPIAKAIVNHFNAIPTIDTLEIKNKIGYGISTIIDNTSYVIRKKMNDDNITVQNDKHTIVVVEKNNVVIGHIELVDELNKNAQQLIHYLQQKNIHCVIVSGDSANSVKKIADELGIPEYYSNVTPEDKNNIILQLKQKYGLIAMVGDGINDSVALSNCDISFAMGQGSDVAIESSDIVLLNDDINLISNIYKKSIKLNNVIKINLFFGFTMIVLLSIMNFFNITNVLISVVGHELSTIIIILHSLKLIL